MPRSTNRFLQHAFVEEKKRKGVLYIAIATRKKHTVLCVSGTGGNIGELRRNTSVRH